ncbi:MAG: carboxypeptidase-like regulatory domain-containing protein [Candidatus Acidiferrales bacterium]
MRRALGNLACLVVGVLLCGFPALSQTQQTAAPPRAATSSPSGQSTPPMSGKLPAEATAATISGTVVDQTGVVISGARVKLARDDRSPGQEDVTGDEGKYSFANVAPGPFQLTISSEGLATQVVTGVARAGETYAVPPAALIVATAVTQVRVAVPRQEMAESEIKEQEKQRVFGAIPNFYVSYYPNAAPLRPKQKFELAWRTTVDPVNFVLVGAIAGVQQAQNDFGGYGQGVQGYGKRYGAVFADSATSTFIGSAILPSLLKQDPRYFYKGEGTARARILYAIANSVICKGDNKRWQPNYSSIVGELAAGGISNLYYPAQDRNGAALTFENALIGIGETAATNLLQEFVIPKFTPKAPTHHAAQP